MLEYAWDVCWRVLSVGVAEWQRKFHTKEYALKFASFAASSHFSLPLRVKSAFCLHSTRCLFTLFSVLSALCWRRQHPTRPASTAQYSYSYSYSSTNLFAFTARCVIRSSKPFLVLLNVQISNAAFRKQTSATALFGTWKKVDAGCCPIMLDSWDNSVLFEGSQA